MKSNGNSVIENLESDIVVIGGGGGGLTAAVAAEAAISSPLLEDVNLSGAKGILVNITAGMDMSIGEFDEVGGTVKDFASDNATVVVGTVIDPEMSGEMRVTIVATGLGQSTREDFSRMKLVKDAQVSVDYKELERPTVMRNRNSQTGANPAEQDPDYLDIPAFLRRQAD